MGVYRRLSINDFINEVKDVYKNDFNEIELRDIYKFYNDNDQENYYPLEEDLNEYWRHYNSFDEMFDDLTDDDEKKECKTKKDKYELMKEIFEYDYEYFKYADGSYLVCVQLYNHSPI